MYLSPDQTSHDAMQAENSSPFRRLSCNRIAEHSPAEKQPFYEITADQLGHLANKMDALIEKQDSLRSAPHRWL